MAGRNSALGSINQAMDKGLTSHRTALQSERQSCFPSPPAPSATCTGKRDSPAGIPTVQGPRSNQTPSRHIPGPDHTPRAGDSSLQCVWENSRQQPLEHKSCCLMTLHKGCGTEPGSLQGAVLLPQHVLCHGHLGKRAGHLEPLLEDFYPKTSPSPQNKSQTSMT